MTVSSLPENTCPAENTETVNTNTKNTTIATTNVVSTTTETTDASTMTSSYRLIVRQQPKKARLCSFKEKMDRRPLDPPPIVQLLTDKSNMQHPYFFLYATLVTENGTEDLTFLKNARTTAGTTVQSLHLLRDNDNGEGVFFIFADVSIRMEGFFKLRFTLFEIIGTFAARRCSVLSDVFQVYSPKSFPGMSESTFLTRSFSEQGVRIRIRKETRSNLSPPSKRRRSDDSHGNAAKPTINTVRHQSLPVIKSTQSIMSMKNILISPTQEYVSHQKNHSTSPPSPTRLPPFPEQTINHSYHPHSLDSDKLTTLDTKLTMIHPNTKPLLSSSVCYSPTSCPSSQSFFHYHPHHNHSHHPSS